jgi:hypothetical protein
LAQIFSLPIKKENNFQFGEIYGYKMVRRCSAWCGVAQLASRRLAVRQARVRFSALLPTEHTSDEEMKRGISE